MRVSLTVDSNKLTTANLQIRERADIVSAPFKGKRKRHRWDGLVEPVEESFNSNHELPEKTDVWFVAYVSAGSGAIVEVDYDILIVENSFINLAYP